MKSLKIIVSVFACAFSLSAVDVAPTPPMGWNSYDCWNYGVVDSQVRNNANYMNTKLKQYGWEYIVVDYIWSCPKVGIGGSYQPPQQTSGFVPHLNMDQYGRLLPDTNRFPSAKGGLGFKPLADYVHSLGLKFGIHLMRGIPRQAVSASCPIAGSSYTASQAALTSSTCSWCNHMYGMNMANAAGQAYLNSILNLYASWGVDFIKVDDLMTAPYHQDEVHGYRTAIDQCGRPVIFSTSPGPTPLVNATDISTHATMWRLLGDLWDTWSQVDAGFTIAANWAALKLAGANHWPDPDMLPLGRLSKYGPTFYGNERWSALTRNEQYTLMSLFCIFRAPLFYGGNLPDNRPSDDSLITNSEVLFVDQHSVNNRVLVSSSTVPIWAADHPDSSNIKYVAMFNRNSSSATVTLALNNLGFTACTIRNLWTKTDLGTFTTSFSQSLGSHASGLYKLTAPANTSIKENNTHTAQWISRDRERQIIVVDGQFRLPEDLAGTSPMLSAYDCRGRLVGVMKVTSPAINLREIFGASAGISIVRIKPSAETH